MAAVQQSPTESRLSRSDPPAGGGGGGRPTPPETSCPPGENGIWKSGADFIYPPFLQVQHQSPGISRQQHLLCALTRALLSQGAGVGGAHTFVFCFWSVRFQRGNVCPARYFSINYPDFSSRFTLMEKPPK